MKQKIKDEMICAMKAGDRAKVDTLRYVLSQINYAEIDKHENLTDTEIIILLQKELKKRKEARELYEKAQRQDLVSQQDLEIKILETYLRV